MAGRRFGSNCNRGIKKGLHRKSLAGQAAQPQERKSVSNLADQRLENQPNCKSCGSDNLFTKIEPPHIALRCRDCGAWQQWVSKLRARSITEQSRIKTYPQTPTATRLELPVAEPKPTTVSQDLTARVERLESEIKQINQELVFYNRIFGANRGPRKVQEFQREITDEHIEAFGRAVGSEQ